MIPGEVVAVTHRDCHYFTPTDLVAGVNGGPERSQLPVALPKVGQEPCIRVLSGPATTLPAPVTTP